MRWSCVFILGLLLLKVSLLPQLACVKLRLAGYCSLRLFYRILGLVCVFIGEEPSRKAMALQWLVIASFVYNIVFLVKNMFAGFYVESHLKKAMALQIASSCM